MGTNQTKQIEITVSTTPNRQKYGYEPDQIWLLTRPKRPNLGLNQTELMKIGELTRSNRPKYGNCPDQTDRNMDFNQNEQTETWVLAKLKYGYWPD